MIIKKGLVIPACLNLLSNTYFWENISCILGWPPVRYVVECYLEVLIILLLSPYMLRFQACVTSYMNYVMLWIKCINFFIYARQALFTTVSSIIDSLCRIIIFSVIFLFMCKNFLSVLALLSSWPSYISSLLPPIPPPFPFRKGPPPPRNINIKLQ